MVIAAGGLLRIGAWRVDPALDEISRNGKTVKLEPRAMQVLVCLAEHAGQVVSVEQLLDAVWKDVIVTPDSVYQAVAGLRRAFAVGTEEPAYIVNVLRRGYRLVAPVSIWIDPIPDSMAKAPAARSDESASPRSESVESWAAAVPVAPQDGTSDSGQTKARTVRRLLPAIAGFAALAIVAGWFTVRSILQSRHTPLTTESVATNVVSQKSIAVLAFVDMSEKHDQEYFGDGMAEELIDQLAQLAELRVISRTSAFQFKAKSDDVRVIGARLSVANILEGSVRRSGDRLRVVVQLVNASDGSNRWSQSYDRSANDIFKVQDEIAKNVVQALKIKLFGTLSQRQPPTENLAAHNLLLEGRFFQERWGPGDSQRAIASYEGAIKADPSYALAWAELSWAKMWLIPGDYAGATRAALRAIELRPDLAQAHATRGWYESLFGYDWDLADAEFNKALELEPQNMRALYGKGRLARVLREYDESIRYYQAAIQRDPVSGFTISGLSSTFIAAGRTAEAVAVAHKALEFTPSLQEGHWYLGYALFRNGEFQAALAEMRLEPIRSMRLSGVALIEQARADPHAADAALRELLASNDPLKPYFVAAVYASRGDAGAAVAWLEHARGSGVGWFAEFSADPAFNPIRGDREFVAFLRRLKLPE
jgi:serine/threonine-protein kinase